MNDLKSAFFFACLPAEKREGRRRRRRRWGGLSALAVSMRNSNLKQQSHRVFVLYGFSTCGEERVAALKAPSGKAVQVC